MTSDDHAARLREQARQLRRSAKRQAKLERRQRKRLNATEKAQS